MWHYSLLGMPIFGLVFFFVLAFEVALIVYLLLVLSALALYARITEQSKGDFL